MSKIILGLLLIGPVAAGFIFLTVSTFMEHPKTLIVVPVFTMFIAGIVILAEELS